MRLFNSNIDKDLSEISSNIMKIVGRKAHSALNKAAEEVSQWQELSEEGIGFHHVTGNLFNSIGVASIETNPKTKHHSGKLFVPAEGHAAPKKRTLAPGEKFVSDSYYDGKTIPGQDKVTYTAPEDSPESGKHDGRRECNAYFEDLKPKRTRATQTWGSITLYSALEYAEYVNAKHQRRWWDTVSGKFQNEIAGLIKSNME